MNFILAGASPLHYYSTGFKPHHLTLNYTGRTDAEAPMPWPPGVKNCLTGKDPDAGKDWRQEEKDGMAAKKEMVR